MPYHPIKRIIAAARDDIGDLATYRPAPAPQETNPFLFINHHGPTTYPAGNSGLPFGPHPHRGFETVTLILQGDLVHRDSVGVESKIGAGGVQWMTAGAGIYHSEEVSAEFQRHGGATEMLQLWLNLPAQLKMSPPAYHGVQAGELTDVALDGGRATLRLVAGQHGSGMGPMTSLTGVFMALAILRPGARIVMPAPEGRQLFLYVIAGSVMIQGQSASARQEVRFDRAGDGLEITSNDGGTILFAHADPIDEPIAWRGPFVMNDEAELSTAFADVRSGRISPGALVG